MTISPGQVIDGKYSITRLIGEGGMGAVYEGVNTRIRRRVAIKVLLSAAKDSAGVVERFEREAQAAGCIGSDHILEVLDLGTLEGGDRYMVMEFLDGESLAERIRRLGCMTVDQIAPLLRQALIGLEAAHAAGIVHRDLKPDNIFILKEKAGRPDFVKLIDFGISKFNALAGDMSMTRTGAVMGTPYYMSPEQAKGAGSVNHQTDLYSMGVIAFEALTGRVPFEGETFNELMFKIVLSDMPDLETVVPGVDPNFAAIVRRATARDTGQRFQSAQEFIAALDAWAPALGARPTLSSSSDRSSSDSGASAVSGASNGGAARAASGQFGTNLDWAASQAEREAAPQKKAPVGLIAAAAAMLLIGGGVLAVVLGGEEEAPASALAPEVAAPSEPASVPEQKAPEAALPPEKPAGEDKKEEPVAPTAGAKDASAGGEKPAPPASGTPAAVKTPTSSASARPAAPAASATPKATPKAPPRSSAPDFGY